MRRALRIGLFIGTFIGMSACAALPGDSFGLPPAHGLGLLRLSYGMLEAPDLEEALRRLFQALGPFRGSR
jgi:aspartate/methionine/tyrosine aminotransferase